VAVVVMLIIIVVIIVLLVPMLLVMGWRITRRALALIWRICSRVIWNWRCAFRAPPAGRVS
jgi:hypothetical protein